MLPGCKSSPNRAERPPRTSPRWRPCARVIASTITDCSPCLRTPMMSPSSRHSMPKRPLYEARGCAGGGARASFIATRSARPVSPRSAISVVQSGENAAAVRETVMTAFRPTTSDTDIGVDVTQAAFPPAVSERQDKSERPPSAFRRPSLSNRAGSVQAPPHSCSASGRVHEPRVRKLVVLYIRPRSSPGGQ